jgi:hypothetical protein
MVVYSTGIYLLAWQGLLVHASVRSALYGLNDPLLGSCHECQGMPRRGIPAPELLASEVELRKPVFTL